jgi:hypothetical protein
VFEETDGQTNKRCLLVGEQVRETDVVSNESGDDTEASTSLGDTEFGTPFASGEEDEGECKEGEQGNEADGFPQRRNEEEESDDGPSNEIDSESTAQLRRAFVSRSGTGARPEDGGIREPEGTIGGESGSTKGVALRELPHAGHELGETTTENSHADNRVRVGDATRVKVIERQNQSRRREGEETKRSGASDGDCPPSSGSGSSTVGVGSFLNIGHSKQVKQRVTK